MTEIIQHPELCNVAMYLGTKDAHGLYEKYGFAKWDLMRRAKG